MIARGGSSNRVEAWQVQSPPSTGRLRWRLVPVAVARHQAVDAGLQSVRQCCSYAGGRILLHATGPGDMDRCLTSCKRTAARSRNPCTALVDDL